MKLWRRHEVTGALLAGLVSGLGAVGYAGCDAGGNASSTRGAGGDGGAAGDAITVGTGGSGGAVCNPGSASSDEDGDGFSEEDGDCNDCDPHANPDAIEVIADPGDEVAPADENCDGTIDEPFAPCDAGLLLDSLDPYEAARAIELCQLDGDGVDWGLVSAAYVMADGAPATPMLNVGLLSGFGDNVVPRAGAAMLGLSTGYARDASQPDGCGTCCCGNTGEGVPPPGFPQVVPGCPTALSVEDDIALEVVLRAPSNAQGLSFDFAFFSFEFPVYVCTVFNDQFVTLVDPAPADAINGNIAFDQLHNPVSVNFAMFDHCDPAQEANYAAVCFNEPTSACPMPPRPYCPEGPQFLAGTGFDIWHNPGRAGSTGWLQTTSVATSGDIVKLRFAIWDASTSHFDSTVILDNVKWQAEPSVVATIPLPE